MAELKYIPFYPGYMEDTSDLSDGEFRRLMYALCAYCEGAERPEPLTGKEVIAYRFITRNIRAAQDQYNAKCKANSENAKKRTQANVSERKRSQANDSQTSQYKEQITKNKEQNITTTTAQARESWQQCVDCYEQNIGALPRAAFDSIVGYLEQVEPDNVSDNWSMRLAWDRYKELGIPLPKWFSAGVVQLGDNAPESYKLAILENCDRERISC